MPPEVATAAGLAYRDRVRGTGNGAAYRSSLMKYSGVFHMGVHKATLAQAGAKHGDTVEVTIERDADPLPNDCVPPELARAPRIEQTIATLAQRRQATPRRKGARPRGGRRSPR